jgi:hypothetical protein
MVIISNAQGENKQSRGENKMANGCYDIDGRCVNCGQYHPCKCEDESNDRKEKEVQE